jgi:septal ring factor EnvC (AmiA/AmiB activator)
MTDRHYYRELKTGYQDFRVVTAISGATVGLHKNIETQEKEISDLKAESNQIQIENRRLNDNVFDLMVNIEELEQFGWQEPSWWILPII